MPNRLNRGAARHLNLLVVIAGCCALIACLLPAPAVAGSFAVNCRFSHRLSDDPIVYAGQPGSSHSHDFFGARSTTAGSTYAAMVGSRSTCTDRADTAGYWHPTLYVGATAVRGVMTAYYSRGGKATVRAYPRGLRVVAGNGHAGAAQSRRIVFWRCVGSGSRLRYAGPVSCPIGARLGVQVNFPDCWNGRDLDSSNHRSHLRYSARGRCPASHAEPLPRLELRVTWPVRPQPGQVSLASGAPYTMHADFWNTWQQRRLRALVNRCLNLVVHCGTVRASA